MNEMTTNLPTVLPATPDSYNVSGVATNVKDETKVNNSEHFQNAPAPSDGDEREWDDTAPFRHAFVDRLDDEDALLHELDDFHVPHSEYLCERQQLAIRLLLIGEREGKVARAVGVGRTTLWKWRKDIHFRDALAACRKLAYANAFDRLGGLVSRAVDCIEHQIAQGNTMAPFRLLRLARKDEEQDTAD